MVVRQTTNIRQREQHTIAWQLRQRRRSKVRVSRGNQIKWEKSFFYAFLCKHFVVFAFFSSSFRHSNSRTAIFTRSTSMSNQKKPRNVEEVVKKWEKESKKKIRKRESSVLLKTLALKADKEIGKLTFVRSSAASLFFSLAWRRHHTKTSLIHFAFISMCHWRYRYHDVSWQSIEKKSEIEKRRKEAEKDGKAENEWSKWTRWKDGAHSNLLLRRWKSFAFIFFSCLFLARTKILWRVQNHEVAKKASKRL